MWFDAIFMLPFHKLLLIWPMDALRDGRIRKKFILWVVKTFWGTSFLPQTMSFSHKARPPATRSHSRARWYHSDELKNGKNPINLFRVNVSKGERKRHFFQKIGGNRTHLSASWAMAMLSPNALNLLKFWRPSTYILFCVQLYKLHSNHLKMFWCSLTFNFFYKLSKTW